MISETTSNAVDPFPDKESEAADARRRYPYSGVCITSRVSEYTSA